MKGQNFASLAIVFLPIAYKNLFSENSVTQWAYNWGQFIDHTIGLSEDGIKSIEIPFSETDTLGFYTNSAENLTVTRSAAWHKLLTRTPKHSGSYIDGWAVYVALTNGLNGYAKAQ